MLRRDLFISHSSSDAKTAIALVGEFERNGISCWIASRDVPIGGAYQAEVVDAITQCRATLLLFSAAANKSEHVLREVELAAQAHKPIYPLRIDSNEPAGGLKYMLANKQWVERRALGDRLVATIEQLLQASGSAEPLVTPQPIQTAPPAHGGLGTPLIWGTAVAVAVIAGAAGTWLLLSRPQPAPPQPAVVVNTPTQHQPSTPASAPVAPKPAVQPKLPNGEKPIMLASVPAHPATVADGRHFFKECADCPIMAIVPAGHGLIGSPADEPGRGADEGPQTRVTFKATFAVSRSEITFDEWFACVAEGGCGAYRPGDYGWGTGQHPVINVSWNDAKAYVQWLSRKTGARYRLLSEAEWEYAARGCKSDCLSTAFWFGNTITPDRADYDWRYSYEGSPKAQALRRTVEADSGEMNPFGLMNVYGNVSEWVEDCWNATLAGMPADGAARTSGDCSSRVLRGGSWADEPKDIRSAARSWDLVGDRRAEIGFRVARSFDR